MPAKLNNGGGGRVSETRFSLLEQKVDSLEHTVNAIDVKIDAILTNRTTNPWKVIGLILAILLPIGFILNLYITSAISPVAAVANQALAIGQTNAAAIQRNGETIPILQQQSATSIQDRSDKQKVLDKLIEIQTKQGELVVTLASESRAGFTEIETQVDSMSQSINMALAEIFRRQGDHQTALHDMGAKMPAAAPGPFVFPNISNRNHRKTQ